MTYSCPRCGKTFLFEAEKDRHVAECGLGYRAKKCIHCSGKGYDVYGRKCNYCCGSGLVP